MEGQGTWIISNAICEANSKQVFVTTHASYITWQHTRYIIGILRARMAHPSIILSMFYFYNIVHEWWYRVDPVYITWKPSVTGIGNVKCFDQN